MSFSCTKLASLFVFATVLLIACISLSSSTSATAASYYGQQWRAGFYLLNHLKRRRNFYLGVAVKSWQLSAITPTNFQCLMPNANMVVPEYEMKWDPIEKEKAGHFDWSGTDKIAAWAWQHKRTFRGHAGIWHEATPGWVQALDGNRKGLHDALYNHVYAVVSRYGKQMHSFDVINEPFENDGSGNFKNSVYWRTLKMDMFTIAFKAADDARRHIGSNVKLYLNEYGFEGESPKQLKKRTALLELVDWMKSNKIPLDGVGIQCHLQVDKFPTNLPGMLKQFTTRGVEVGFTEVDIRIQNSDQSVSTLEKQAKQYGIIYETCLSNSKCVMIVRWNFNDDVSWIAQNTPGWGRGTVFGSKCRPKPRIMKEILGVLDRF